ncbi:MAG: hypothetical protein LBD64_00740 [Odoribacteraceae bacterium]|jgi:hypothetical protein|nr:hypothetical protein [Odoribacteraceae bacterium]
MRRISFFLSWLLLFVAGCDTGEVVTSPTIGNKYDPSKPRVITEIMPLSGEIGEKFVVRGNFGPDLDNMKVLFAGQHEAVLISTDGISIYGIVPKQPNGDNTVEVWVGDEQITTGTRFSYIQNQRVSTVSGKYNTSAYTDGNIFDARFQSLVAVGVVDGDNIIAVETHNQRIRLVSQTESKVTTLMTGFCTGKPAVNQARDKIYFVELYNNAHKVFVMEKETGWVPRKIRENISELNGGELWSCALDKTEKYLYVRNQRGVFVRVYLEEYGSDGQLKVEVLLNILPTGNSNAFNMLVYSPVDDCFFASQMGAHGIYRIWQEATTSEWQIEEYAGFIRAGAVDGDRKTEAQFNYPFGMTVDREGNLYVAESYNYLIRKISRATGMVTTVAGRYRATGGLDGLPLESTFNDPQDIAVDSEDNFFIVEQGAKTIRKLAIE